MFIPESALALLSDTSSGEVPLSLCPEAPFMVRVSALLLKPAVRLPFDADAEPTLAPEPAMLLEPSIGPTTTTAPFPLLFPLVLRLATDAAPVLAAAVPDEWMALSAEPACSAGVPRIADTEALVSATVSFSAVLAAPSPALEPASFSEELAHNHCMSWSKDEATR